MPHKELGFESLDVSPAVYMAVRDIVRTFGAFAGFPFQILYTNPGFHLTCEAVSPFAGGLRVRNFL
jgi:hypothetical protein